MHACNFTFSIHVSEYLQLWHSVKAGGTVDMTLQRAKALREGIMARVIQLLVTKC